MQYICPVAKIKRDCGKHSGVFGKSVSKASYAPFLSRHFFCFFNQEVNSKNICLKINLSEILNITGKIQTGVQFHFSVLDFFLKNGLKSTVLKTSGDLAVEIPLLKLCIINSKKYQSLL